MEFLQRFYCPKTVVNFLSSIPYSNSEYVNLAGMQGTSRPTHYHVLVNENKLSPDDIQGLTNNLCYTFGRCTTSVSMGKPLQGFRCFLLSYVTT